MNGSHVGSLSRQERWLYSSRNIICVDTYIYLFRYKTIIKNNNHNHNFKHLFQTIIIASIPSCWKHKRINQVFTKPVIDHSSKFHPFCTSCPFICSLALLTLLWYTITLNTIQIHHCKFIHLLKKVGARYSLVWAPTPPLRVALLWFNSQGHKWVQPCYRICSPKPFGQR